ncbi:MAG: GNAT family N-acetyltransferase [Frankiaceae bacterium]
MAELDLDVRRQALLAELVEETARSLGRIRYGSVLEVGSARVVLNPDSPLASSNFAGTVRGSPGRAAATLRLLPSLWREAGRGTVVLLDSPSCVPELGVIAEECGYESEEEGAVLVLTEPAALVEGEPGRTVRPLTEDEEHAVAGLVADAMGYSGEVELALCDVFGQRLDDPRVSAWGTVEDGELAGVALGFVDVGIGMVTDVAVRADRRGRGAGRALVSAAAADCLRRGATVVHAVVEAGGAPEALWHHLGFATAYTTVTYVLRIDA